MPQSWVRFHFMHLRRWRSYAEAVARAACDVVGEARVYVVGSIARGTYTVLSDIDVLVVVPRGRVRRGLVRDIMLRAMDSYGLPWDAPVELHIVEEGEEEAYLREGAVPIAECRRGGRRAS